MQNKVLTSTLSIGLAIVLFVCVNIIADFVLRSARFDLTATGQYTLSQGTKNILDELNEAVHLKFYYSAEMAANYPQLRVYGNRVRDLLLEYATRAGDGIELEVIDPKPFSEAEDLAVAEGVTAIPTDTGDSLYFGLVGTNSIDGRELIPYFAQERDAFLEFDLTELIYNLVRTKKPVLGILSTLPLDVGPGGMMAAMQGQSQPYLIYDQLQANFDVRMLGQDLDRIDEEVTTLLVVHPADLAPSAVYAIDQFVLRGGRAAILVDPLSEIANIPSPMGQGAPGPAVSSNLEQLFASWGIDYDDGKVVGDLASALRVQTSMESGRPFADYVVWLGLRRDNMNDREVVSADLNLIQMAAVGHLSQAEGAESKFRALVQSTSQSKLYDRDLVQNNIDPDELLLDFAPTVERYTVAAKVSGKFSTAFADGPPPKEEADEEASVDTVEEEPEPLPAHMDVAAEETNIIVVADTDFLDDRFWVQTQDFLGQRIVVPMADNAVFLINAIESLMGSSDLISLRSRGRDDRPLLVINDIRQRAEAQFLREQERLEAQLQETEQRILQLQSQGGDNDVASALVLTPEQEQEINRFQDVLLETRAQLRAVQRNLRVDVERLQSRVQFINMALMPFLIGALAFVVSMVSRRKRARAVSGTAQ